MAKLPLADWHPGLSVDCVIFGFHNGALKVLLLQMQGMDKWALPGGFVRKAEDVDEAAVRVLEERTGLKEIFLEQYRLFGQAGRSTTEHARVLHQNGWLDEEDLAWFQQRFVSAGYYALVEYSKVSAPRADYFSSACEWWPLERLPDLMLDHSSLLDAALAALRLHLNHKPVGLSLLPEQFTMPELQQLYEAILGKSLDRRNFQRRMLGYGILCRTGERRRGGAHKAPWLYEFEEEAYEQALQSGLGSTW
ncbi:NUDIX hydrolase [Phaeodactylibacter luteus]|uniref:NUDIX hydrolase n=1 Tax=Phaeodactylibacter luteus TaxID=1564516 RepID=A0A5C6RI80_9BACT|nr:NUDIX domain-containing protein [Phaeodactylibacter luteus]TXB61823.1 NUDIX hydrolase [Phaeodactylibacter luteus]